MRSAADDNEMVEDYKALKKHKRGKMSDQDLDLVLGLTNYPPINGA